MDAPDRLDAVTEHWGEVIDEMADRAAAYREDGVDAVEIHPGDVAVVGVGDHDPGRVGFDVVAPDDEFERLRSVLAEVAVDGFEVFRAVDGGIVYALVVVETVDDEAAVLVPLYYEREDLEALRDVVAEHDALFTRVHNLALDDIVTFTHADPDPFFPDGG